jgi:hypothetical protein
MATNDLKQIGFAMHNYHESYGRFPPPAIHSKDGQALLSWRVSILPFLEENKLFREFHLDEPWDSPHNRTLIPRMPKVYKPLGDADTEPFSTLYQVLVGKGTAFEGNEGINMRQITDGTSNTILVIEAGEAVPWTKPADLIYDPDKPLPKFGGMFKERFRFSTLSYTTYHRFNSVFADGSVHSIQKTIDEMSLRALITRNGGETIISDDF